MANEICKAKSPLLLGLGLLGTPIALLAGMIGLSSLMGGPEPNSESSKVEALQAELEIADKNSQPSGEHPVDHSFYDAVNNAMAAATAAQTANNWDGWKHVGDRFTPEIALIEAVPESSE